MKYILNSKWKLSIFYVLLKVQRFKKIIEKINASNNICVNMEPPEVLKERPVIGDPNSSTQGISGILEK